MVPQAFHQAGKYEKRNKLIDILKEGSARGTIVFVENCRFADFLASFLSESGTPATSINGTRFRQQRIEAMDLFNSGRMMLVTSRINLDLRSARHLINYDMPTSINDYLHRIQQASHAERVTSFYDRERDSALADGLYQIFIKCNLPVPELFTDGDAEVLHQLECPVCRGHVRGPYSTLCGHIYCRHCLIRTVQEQKKCTICSERLTLEKIHKIFINLE